MLFRGSWHVDALHLADNTGVTAAVLQLISLSLSCRHGGTAAKLR